MRRPVSAAAAILVMAASVLFAPGDGVAAPGDNSITSPDTVGNVGRWNSLALDGSGYPVVGYWDEGNGDLKVLHCNDPDCTGGDESIQAVDTAGNVGVTPSLVLDGDGYPVVSYGGWSPAYLKVLHCNDANCAGGDESIQAVDTASGYVGFYASLTLDGSGYPVVSYFDAGPADLKVLHCNDANCAGGDESIQTVDSAGWVGENISMALDANGYPVVSYRDNTNGDLKVLHCNDANCAGGDESIEAVDTAEFVGATPALSLDGNGFPVVSYYDLTNGDLKVLHCNDANCAGGDESTQVVDEAGDVGVSPSMALNASGHPVVSYYDTTNRDLKVLHCNDANCAGGNESIESVDTGGDAATGAGAYTSLALDGSGHPVVSYWDGTNGDLKVLHCGTVTCVPAPGDTDGDGCMDAQENGLNPVLGGDRDPLNYWDFYDVRGPGGPKDKFIDFTDTLFILQHFGHAVSPTPKDATDPDLSRSIPDPSKPWRTAQSTTLVDFTDALNNLKSFGHSCKAAPN